MRTFRGWWRKKDPIPPPGDDVVPVPPPVTEEPPHDRFCDLVLTGGVASGVVYPWAIVELARKYRFRNIGGTSVGAMAAALAAAAEYGRRTGYENPFEALRRAPASLGETSNGRTRMLSLFQTNAHGRRLIRLWGKIFNGDDRSIKDDRSIEDSKRRCPRRGTTIRALLLTLDAYRVPVLLGATIGVVYLRIGAVIGDCVACLPLDSALFVAVVLLLLALLCCFVLYSVRDKLPADKHAKRPSEKCEKPDPPCNARRRVVRLKVVAFRALRHVYYAIGLTLACVLCVLLGLGLQGDAALLNVAFFALVSALSGLVVALLHDIRYGLIENSYGLCKGGNLEGNEGPPGISQWLHDGIQASAGLGDTDPPLTFRDLWTAPAFPGAERSHCGRDDPADQRSINLQMLTTNVTHGRPYRLPMVDNTSRLFFRPKELEDYFPPCVLHALVESSQRYAPRDALGNPGRDPSPAEETTKGLLELPAEDLPVVVAARLSLSFPLLFSAVPLWAIDYEAPRGARTLRRCMFTDGGASSNFPIHLFDAAVPRWPTFGLWLDKRGPYRHDDPEAKKAADEKKAAEKTPAKAPGCAHEPREDGLPEQEVWLPEYNDEGRGDSWNRFDPDSKAVDPCPKPVTSIPRPGAPEQKPERWKSTLVRCPEASPAFGRNLGPSLFGFLSGIITSATDWRDRTNFRLPHIRNRVARLLLLPGEGGLHIGMPRDQILSMAHRYGTKAGQLFVKRFAEDHGQPAPAWEEQRWIRFNLLVNGLRQRLDGMTTSAAWSTHAVPLKQAIDAATQEPGPVRYRRETRVIKPHQAQALARLLCDLERLESTLQLTEKVFDSPPEPELRLTAPL